MLDNPPVKYTPLGFTFTCVKLLLFLGDIVLDAWAIVSFYQEEAYVCMWLLLLFMICSSVIVQVNSWLWYRDERHETSLSLTSLKTLHVFQMGVFLRYAGVVVRNLRFFTKKPNLGGDTWVAVALSHELGLLRLIENFTESAPQLVLFLTIMIQRGEVELFTLLKAAVSASAIAYGVTQHYRRLEEADKKKQTVCASLVYFLWILLWRLLLIAPRIAALSLFASVLPRVIFAHFLCSWMILFYVAPRFKPSFMDSVGGEWLWRATVGLIWYFSLFNAGQTRLWSRLYHAWMMLDLVLLCGLWCWRIYYELPQPHYTFIVSSVIIAVYGIGLACGVIVYHMYSLYHPKMKKDPKCEAVKSLDVPVEQDTIMKKLSENFYYS